mgnify:CR=1 FL=1
MLSKKLISLIKKNITIIDDSREIPSEVIDELVNENYFRLLLPKTYGGLEINFLEYLEIVTEVASYDASLAWCINQSNVLATNAAFMDKVLAEKALNEKLKKVESFDKDEESTELQNSPEIPLPIEEPSHKQKTRPDTRFEPKTDENPPGKKFKKEER